MSILSWNSQPWQGRLIMLALARFSSYNYLMNQDIESSSESERSVRQLEIGMRFKDVVRENQSATDMFDEAFTQFLGVNRTDGRCLDIIDRHGRVTAGVLATESGLTTGAVTAVIDRLEQQGYVLRIRDPNDRRKVFVELTPACRTITEHIFGHFARLSPAIMRRFSARDVQAIVAFLEMGALVNREMAAVLARASAPQSADLDQRIATAKLFEDEATAGAPRIDAALNDILKRAMASE